MYKCVNVSSQEYAGGEEIEQDKVCETLSSLTHDKHPL